MTKNQHRRLLALEGRRVSVALVDGSRIDDCQLVSTRVRVRSLWLAVDNTDVFVPIVDVADVWERALQPESGSKRGSTAFHSGEFAAERWHCAAPASRGGQ